MNKMLIENNRYIGEKQPCFIIAEIGINHNGSINMAKKMVDECVRCGVDAVKFQTFKADEFVSNKKQVYTYISRGRKVRESMYKMFKRYEFNEKQWKEIFRYCKKKKILCFKSDHH